MIIVFTIVIIVAIIITVANSCHDDDHHHHDHHRHQQQQQQQVCIIIIIKTVKQTRFVWKHQHQIFHNAPKTPKVIKPHLPIYIYIHIYIYMYVEGHLYGFFYHHFLSAHVFRPGRTKKSVKALLVFLVSPGALSVGWGKALKRSVFRQISCMARDLTMSPWVG